MPDYKKSGEFFERCVTLRNGLGLDGRQNDVIAVHDDDRTRPAAMGGINKAFLFLGLVFEAFHGGGIGGNDRNDAVRHRRTADVAVETVLEAVRAVLARPKHRA